MYIALQLFVKLSRWVAVEGVLALFGSYKGYELLDYYFPMILMFLPSACFLLSKTNRESSSFRSYPYVYKSLSCEEVGQECMSNCQLVKLTAH